MSWASEQAMLDHMGCQRDRPQHTAHHMPDGFTGRDWHCSDPGHVLVGNGQPNGLARRAARERLWGHDDDRCEYVALFQGAQQNFL